MVSVYLKIYNYYSPINATYFVLPLFRKSFYDIIHIIIACCYCLPTNIYTNYVMSHNCTNT